MASICLWVGFFLVNELSSKASTSLGVCAVPFCVARTRIRAVNSCIRRSGRLRKGRGLRLGSAWAIILGVASCRGYFKLWNSDLDWRVDLILIGPRCQQ